MVERVIYRQRATGTKNTGTSSPLSSNIWLPNGTTSGFASMALNTVYYQLYCRTAKIDKSVTFNARYEVVTAGAISTTRIGLYTMHPTSFIPYELIVDGGTASNSSTGEKTVSLTAINLPVYFYVATVRQGTDVPIFRGGGGTQGWFHTFYGRSITVSSASSFGGWEETGVSGALPSTATPSMSNITSTSGIAMALEIP